MTRRSARAIAAGLAAWAVLQLAAAPIAGSKHDLSVTGPGPFKATQEPGVCIFCHAPHNVAPYTALWNRATPSGPYIPYASSTAQGGMANPTGSSLMCLSCHDGTIALGSVLSRSAGIAMAGGSLLTGATVLGTDLRDDHPVSIAYNAALLSARDSWLPQVMRGELADPSTLTGKVRLDFSAPPQMQCTACHDPHDNANGKFLVMPNVKSALCTACHTKNYWAQSSHSLSTVTWNGAGINPWPHTTYTNVADNACEGCHRPHSAAGAKWLLNTAAEEGNCNPCHNGNVAAKNLQAEFSKLSTHPVASYTGVHDAMESAVITSRHVECVDCHNPHANKDGAGTPPGALTAVRGVAISYGSIFGSEALPSARYEYEVCFRCHGDSQPSTLVARQVVSTNIRQKFDRSNPSLHPVGAVGRSSNVPSLIPPWTTASQISCGDCHNNNAGPNSTTPPGSGTGPNGPHGSTFAPLLERNYVRTDNTPESAARYALCYKCHDRGYLYANNNRNQPFGGINGHLRHLGPDINAPCSACHDPHGVYGTPPGTNVPANYARLINFDTTIVLPTTGGKLPQWVQTAPNAGLCYLRCHGQNHNPETYP